MDSETIDEIKRHFGVVAEQIRSDVRAVAEGQQQLRDGLASFRAEVEQEFEETRSLIRLSYSELDRRVRTIEHDMADLRARLERVEGRPPS